MSGGFYSENDPNYRFSGYKFYFNSYTLRGRFNIVVATYGTLFGLIALRKLTKRKAKAVTES